MAGEEKIHAGGIRAADHADGVRAVDLEKYLEVGCPAVFHSDPLQKLAPRYPTAIRGWLKPSYVLLDRPKSRGHFASLRENQDCIIRFVRDGKACGFHAIVLDWDIRNHSSYCRVCWPDKIDMVPFRRFERISVCLPCRIDVEGRQAEGEVYDLGIGGCRIATKVPLDKDTEMTLSFVLPDGCAIDHVRGTVRNARNIGDEFFCGCEFAEGQTYAECDIAFYVTLMLDRHGKRPAEAHRILIIDGRVGWATELHRIFQDRGYEAIVAAETVDGLSRLRLLPPSALLINHAQEDMPGIETVRLVRRTRGYQQLPVFLYGGTEPDLEARAQEAGATEYLGASPPLFVIVSAIVDHLTSLPKQETQFTVSTT